MFKLNNKTAVVTGGGSGIGKAICLLFGEQGANVAVVDLNLEAAQKVADQIIENGGKAIAVAADVANAEAVETAMGYVEQKTGGLHILVNNAGISQIGNLENTTPEMFDRIYNINVKGVYNCLKSGLPIMKRSGGGSIVNMASIASVTGLKDRFGYSMTKGAVFSMTLSVAADYINDNIRCNCIAPARVHTPFVDDFLAKNYAGREAEVYAALSKTQPIGRMGKPEEVAALTLYLASDEAGFVTGSIYPIDGGFIYVR